MSLEQLQKLTIPCLREYHHKCVLADATKELDRVEYEMVRRFISGELVDLSSLSLHH